MPSASTCRLRSKGSSNSPSVNQGLTTLQRSWNSGSRHSFHCLRETPRTVGVSKKTIGRFHSMYFTKHLFGDPAPTITGTAFLVTNASADATDGEEPFLIPRGGQVRGCPIQDHFMCTDHIWTLIESHWDHLPKRMRVHARSSTS